MSNLVHHAQTARVGSTRGKRDPLQLVDHSGDAAGVVPAIAHIGPTGPHDAAPSPVFARCNVCGAVPDLGLDTLGTCPGASTRKGFHKSRY